MVCKPNDITVSEFNLVSTDYAGRYFLTNRKRKPGAHQQIGCAAAGERLSNGFDIVSSILLSAGNNELSAQLGK